MTLTDAEAACVVAAVSHSRTAAAATTSTTSATTEVGRDIRYMLVLTVGVVCLHRQVLTSAVARLYFADETAHPPRWLYQDKVGAVALTRKDRVYTFDLVDLKVGGTSMLLFYRYPLLIHFLV